MKIKRLAAAAAPVGAAIVGSACLAAAPANAATENPHVAQAGKTICTGDLCLQTICYDPSTYTYHIDLWAYDKTFYGHFEMSNSTGAVSNSPTRSWPAGGRHWVATPSIGVGSYSAKAWKDDDGKYTDIGHRAFSINSNDTPEC